MPIYFTNSPVREPFIFESVGTDWVQEATSRPDGHPLYHYLQTVSGCGRITIQEKSFFLNENEGVLIAPSIRHSYAGRTPRWLTCFATFTGTIEGSIPRILKNRPTIFIEKEQGARIGEMIRRATHKYEAPPLNTQELSLDCYQLLLQFVDGLADKSLLEDPLYLRYVAPTVEQIETHYSSPVTVDELSRTVYVTPQYLSRLFRRFLGCSVYEYLTSCRISRAKELLLTYPRLGIQEIAGRVGFSDASHFIAMFKKATGRTPLEFRRFH